MPSTHTNRRSEDPPPPEPQARGDMDGFFSGGAHATIIGGTGGSGGASTLQGGTGGIGEGPQFHMSAVETSWNILVNGNASYHYNSLSDHDVRALMQRKATRNSIIRLLRLFSEYIRGDREKALFVSYCILSAVLFPGSLSVMNRLRLVPIIILPFLVVPRLLALCDTFILVDVMGQRRPVFLDVWENREVFVAKLQEFFGSNEVIMNIVQSQQYQIQDAEYCVHRPGSGLVAPGTTLFMAALFHRSQMTCPWCNIQVPISPGWNLQILFDW
ncbi:hypothetical protein R3P38DRAFT_3170686 [Favolaschia claudopus]|uniref:Uncharacterized protein n=1 Tax=Favolaschia claudopus TaxID=2862362 RepID=A0AAW0DWT9_9AGAR